jgi:sugar phosphate isomerase/epimerase
MGGQTTLEAPGLAAVGLPPALRGRLGLDVPREHWPTVPRPKALEAAGFAWLQVHCPPTTMLADPDAAAYHATALSAVLEQTGLRLVLHAPDDLVPGSDRRALAGLAAHVNCARAEIVVVHGTVAPDRDREVDALRELAAAIAPALVDSDAPLLLELHPPHRPEPQSLATVTAELLTR